jgi:hypothetical protein
MKTKKKDLEHEFLLLEILRTRTDLHSILIILATFNFKVCKWANMHVEVMERLWEESCRELPDRKELEGEEWQKLLGMSLQKNDLPKLKSNASEMKQ